MENKTVFDFIRSKEFSNISDPALFFDVRRQLITEALAISECSDPLLHDRLIRLQEEVDCIRALQASPRDKLQHLLPLLKFRVEALEKATQQLQDIAAADSNGQ